MRILIMGFVAFLIWSVFSAWMYNDKLLPVINAPDPAPSIPEKTIAADSSKTVSAAMPEKLTIYFEFDDAEFRDDQQTDSRIAEFRQLLEKYPGSKLLVTGHTDLTGTESYNLDLAMKRARAVGEYFQKQGIGADRMTVESKGESEPASDYLTSEGRAMNRRTEITIKLQ